MPNNISNELTIHSDNFKKALSFVCTTIDDTTEPFVRHFDMNKIIPMPPELEDSESSTFATKAHICYLRKNGLPILKRYNYSEWHIQYAPDLLLHERYTYDQIMDMGKKVHKLFEKYGYGNWYDWSVANWGSKWNTYQSRMIADNILYFESAWSPPIKMVEKFIAAFKLTATYRIICEGHCTWGIREYVNGELTSSRMDDPSDLNKLCMDLKGYNPDDDDEE